MNISFIVKLIEYLFASTTTGSKNSSTNQPSSTPVPKEEEGFYVWKKGENISLSKYFSSAEFSCRCNFPDCKTQRISKTLITKLDLIRVEIKQPLIVTSAYRCMKYQAFLRSSGVNTVVAKQSTHEQGQAVDVIPKDGKIDGFEQVCAKHFDSIGLAKNFLHLDLRLGYRRWKY